MKEFSNYLSIEIIDISIQSIIRCAELCPSEDSCFRWRQMKQNDVNLCSKVSSVKFIIENHSDEYIRIVPEYFKALDDDGFIIEGRSLCEEYSQSEDCFSGLIQIPEKSRCRYEVIFLKAKSLSLIKYKAFDDQLTLDLNKKDLVVEEEIFVLRKKVEDLCVALDQYKMQVSELEELLSAVNTSSETYREHIERHNNDLLCKYTSSEDEEYYRIYSDEENDTIAFNREFDKSKGNYNWINIGDALIAIRTENAMPYCNGVRIIQSPVSGVFEFNSNKLISYKQEICRIKKHPQSKKNEIIDLLEREEIKNSIYKKERKKMIERETLDELLSEGKIFNYYTKKDGNRTTIAMDVANAVWNRDGGKCCICGLNQELEFDHIIPLSKGGATTFRNLQLLCKSCNRIKSDNI